MFLADFHLHSNFSDGKFGIPALVDHFGRRGFGAIAITDHFCEQESIIGKASSYLGVTLTSATFPIYRALLESEKERAWDQYKMCLIPGVEITKNSILNHRSAHFLVLGNLEGIDPNQDISELSDLVRPQGALVIAAHPVSTQKIEKQTFHLWDRREELASKVDAWEVASGPYLFPEVRASGLPMIANSDFHSEKNMNSWKTLLNCERKQEAIFQAIQKQEVQFQFYREEKPRESYHLAIPRALGSQLGHYGLGNMAGLQSI